MAKRKIKEVELKEEKQKLEEITKVEEPKKKRGRPSKKTNENK